MKNAKNQKLEENRMSKKLPEMIGIAGAGTMGASMCQIFAEYGYQVVLYTRSQKTLDKAKELILLNQKTKVACGDSTEEKAKETLAHITYAAPGDLTCFRECSLIVESIVEDMEAKHIFWKEVSAMVDEDAVLTTNTSGLSITEIAKAVHRPERFRGMHWFNPPHIIPLIEVISGERTEKRTADIVYRLAEEIGKKPIYVAKDAPGFIANRIQLAVLRECLHIKKEGIGDYSDIDRCMKYGLGFRYACLGPMEVCDQGGLDTFYHIASYLFADLADDKDPDDTILGELFQKGEYGVKTKKGFYDYSDGKDQEAIRLRDEMYLAMAKANVTGIAE